MAPTPVNRSRLLALLRDEGPLSRVALGERLGVPRAALSAELGRLGEVGLVEEGGPAASRGGRRSVLVRLAAELRVLAVAVGATSVTVAVADGRCEVLARVTEESDVRDGPVVVLERVVRLAARVRELAPGRVVAAGVGLPGPVSFRDGVPVAPPIMPGWDRYPVRDELAARWGCPVAVDNDVNAMALGERHAGVARSLEDLLFVKVGTGVGCGIVLGGRVYRGVAGAAGDIGHIRLEEDGPVCACGGTGCLEAWFSGAALARDAVGLARSGRSPLLAAGLAERGGLTARDVGVAASAGDYAAAGLVRDGGRRLGQVVASLVSFLNPGMVVIGGGVSGLGHSLLAEVRGVVHRRSLPLATGNLPIVLSELGDEAGVVGAAWTATERVFAV
ncbi:ROK family transcriptional regulator [Actinosynnema pretiosum subsp. pretiosum]|uniref:ROK family protein n=2 Tax=Actinosynnema TaxID=40566 RepID=C6WJL3_ACTMD|nr:ROK family transcriptional regulator [Actinosynnema mirum]ACU36238.1 ROK family protein [Actinosynnema mirum DSM 43827]AXX29691.1 Mlc, transcriptional repressor of MalT [Actinosynnema pretiosum subsp. pretiosum]QUF06085.1 ROK family transcriptional regulator [Actinosynnema pretiosum subsp. pretiosum]